MALSAFQKVAMVSGLVLCVSLLPAQGLPVRGRRPEPPPAPSGKMGRFPPMMHHQMPSDGPAAGAHFPRSHLAEAIAKTKGSGGSVGGGGGRGLMGQIIPIYGFGILLYILYILFKLSSKGKTTAEERKSATALHGNPTRKITNYELAQLQEKLRETEEAMEKLINRVGPNYERAQNMTSDQEKRLLQQLREITRVMKEGKLRDSPSPEKEAEEAPYMEDWEGYPEETYPVYDLSDCVKRRPDTILVDYPDLSQASAEEIAERMGGLEEEEDHLCCDSLPADLGEVSQDCQAQKDKPVSFSDLPPSQKVECTCCQHEEDDPAIIAENMVFPLDSSREPEETYLHSREAVLGNRLEEADEAGTLRKRNLQGFE
ncbi:LOW QUALITY PROTEIN: protein RIC-3 [Dromiciops gliroides]|uniref:LOW QUALITY PROTEIN: protein RIC-3 n=1 Tax=Dromiciops gliroides TaxID=33562 RepID=UPI001CC7DC78|nr:LOW QUALITY PROTEIN: protein RIC-3 [Dromiciops gliroides]